MPHLKGINIRVEPSSELGRVLFLFCITLSLKVLYLLQKRAKQRFHVNVVVHETLGSGISVPVRLLISRYFPRGKNLNLDQSVELFRYKYIFCLKYCKKAIFQHYRSIFQGGRLLLLSNVPGGKVIPDPRVHMY